MVELVLDMPIGSHLRLIQFHKAIVADGLVGSAVNVEFADFVAICEEKLVRAEILPGSLAHK